MRKLKLDELNRISTTAFQEMDKRPVVLVLDNIRSGLNVGSCFRTADAFALEHVYLCGITARPPHREILKSAIGATNSVSWSGYENIRDCIQDLRETGYLIAGVEQTSKSVLLSDFTMSPEAKIALVFGNEVNGLTDDALPLLDVCLEIPQFGTKHSLNVAVCVGIVVWHIAQQVKL